MFPGVNALVEDGIADNAQPHFQLLHFHFRPAVTLFSHHLLTINSPAFNERAALKNCAHQGRRPEFVGVRQLQIMSRHRFVHGQVANHVIVVFLKNDSLRCGLQSFGVGSTGEECLPILLERSRRIAVSDPAAAFEFRHDNDIKRFVRHGYEVMLFGEIGCFADNFLRVTDDGIVVRMLLRQFLEHSGGDFLFVIRG